MGGNAVLGFHIAFDLESTSGGLVVRGFGTACTIHKVYIHISIPLYYIV
jgi:hypothetical protein